MPLNYISEQQYPVVHLGTGWVELYLVFGDGQAWPCLGRCMVHGDVVSGVFINIVLYYLGWGGGGLVMVGPDPWRSTSLVLVMSL